MPMYTYTCDKCGYIFEEIVQYDKRDAQHACGLCGGDSQRKVAEVFGIKTSLDPQRDTIYSPKEIDKVVGEKAEKKWAGYDERWKNKYKERQEKRWKEKSMSPVNLPKDIDGKYTPLQSLGDSKERGLRKEYVTALQEHRADRNKKGISQFDGPGAIAE